MLARHVLPVSLKQIIYEIYVHLFDAGLIADDPRMLVSYYVVFIFSSFKLRSDHFSGFSDSDTYRQMRSQRKNAFVWRDLSLETKSFWTFLDYVRLYAYCHLLDIVLALIAITGTLEYDFLHLGYLGFALVFFRMRLEILKKKNKIFFYSNRYAEISSRYGRQRNATDRMLRTRRVSANSRAQGKTYARENHPRQEVIDICSEHEKLMHVSSHAVIKETCTDQNRRIHQ